MDWMKLAIVLLINDALLFGLSMWTEKIKDKHLNDLIRQADEDEAKELEGIDWELEEAALESVFISRDEVAKMNKAQLYCLNAWVGEELDRKES